MARAHDPIRRVLPFSAWPRSDRASWERLFVESDDPFADGPHVKWSSRTRQTNLAHYGRWLGFLQSSGLLNEALSPGDRVTTKSVMQYYGLLSATVAPWTCVGRLVGLQVVIRAFAPEQDWYWLKRICNRLHAGATTTRNKRDRIRATDEIVKAAIARLATLPAGPLSRRQATAFRDALMLAFLALRPLRAKNFVELKIGRHVCRTKQGWLIVVPRDETKNHQHLEYSLPQAIIPWFDRYVQEIRPVFDRGLGSDELWLLENGGPLHRHALRKQIVKLTSVLLGSGLNPHLLRDCAASTLAIAGRPLAAAPLLGHRNFATTERYYIQSYNIAASRRVSSLLRRRLCSDAP